MRKFTLAGVSLLFFSFLFVASCKKENIRPVEEPVIQPIEVDEFRGIKEYIEGQNAIINIVNYIVTAALLTPGFNSFASNEVETRACPDFTLNLTCCPRTLELDFDDCMFSHPLSMSSSNIDGTILFENFGTSLTQSGINNFIRFDEVKMGNKIVRFVGPDEQNKSIKLNFIGDVATNNFEFQALLDGTPGSGDPVLDRNRFEIINCDTGDSTVIYPSYSNNIAFSVTYTNPNDPTIAPTLDYESFAKGCYSLDLSSTIGRYFESGGTEPEEDYNITKVIDPNTGMVLSSPIIFKPFCEWLIDGQLMYTDIPTIGTGGFVDESDDPFRIISYNANSTMTLPATGVCDSYVLIEECDQFFNNTCSSGYSSILHDCQ